MEATLSLIENSQFLRSIHLLSQFRSLVCQKKLLIKIYTSESNIQSHLQSFQSLGSGAGMGVN